MTTETTVYAKGVRQRREQKMIFDSDPEVAAMMENMAPSLTTISQCDLKQDVTLNDKKKTFFIDYYDWSGLSPEQQKRRPNQKVVVRGTVTISSIVTDSGKRQQMFGLTAKWMKSVMSIDSSADSCDGKSNFRLEQEGWFVNLALTSDSCKVRDMQGPGSTGGCRPRTISGPMQTAGFFLEGTTKSYQDNKLTSTSSLQTTALSKAVLDQGLFEIPIGYKEVDSFSELMQSGGMKDMSEVTQITTPSGNTAKGPAMKTVAVDYFSGNTSNVDQEPLREYISNRLTSAGMSGFRVNSQADLATGNFANVIGVELKKVKESGASKVGGLFGKVTGNTDAANIGTSEASIVITIYGNDRKTVVASASATKKVNGKGNDAVKAAIDEIIGGLLAKIK
ncbi:MAG: hypothetical protein KA746_02680 [Pyrinomonadaceae bacterium]|nr:hypothetical protein [Pyrinomonadaceae bacterium]MBP6212371.1 hypothetical protein [Pyrinomonadaceae bacterium]